MNPTTVILFSVLLIAWAISGGLYWRNLCNIRQDVIEGEYADYTKAVNRQYRMAGLLAIFLLTSIFLVLTILAAAAYVVIRYL